MNKTLEIEIIREFVERLGPDSYLGPILKADLPFIETNISNDIYPPSMLSRIDEAWTALKETDAALLRGREALEKQARERAMLADWFGRMSSEARTMCLNASELEGNVRAFVRQADKAWQEARTV